MSLTRYGRSGLGVFQRSAFGVRRGPVGIRDRLVIRDLVSIRKLCKDSVTITFSVDGRSCIDCWPVSGTKSRKVTASNLDGSYVLPFVSQTATLCRYGGAENPILLDPSDLEVDVWNSGDCSGALASHETATAMFVFVTVRKADDQILGVETLLNTQLFTWEFFTSAAGAAPGGTLHNSLFCSDGPATHRDGATAVVVLN